MGIFEKVRNMQPNTNACCTAVDTLTNPAEVREFFTEYVLWLSEHGCEKAKKDPLKAAADNISHIISGYYGGNALEKHKRWLAASPHIRHMVYGRNLPNVEPKEEYPDTYTLIFKAEMPEIEGIVLEELSSQLEKLNTNSNYLGSSSEHADNTIDSVLETAEVDYGVKKGTFPMFEMKLLDDKNPDSKYKAVRLQVNNRSDLDREDKLNLCIANLLVEKYIRQLKRIIKERYDHELEIFTIEAEFPSDTLIKE